MSHFGETCVTCAGFFQQLCLIILDSAVQQQQLSWECQHVATKAGAVAAREGFGRASRFSHCWGAQHQGFSQHITWECWIVFLDWDQICSNHTPADSVVCLIVWSMCPASISIYNTVYIYIYCTVYIYNIICLCRHITKNLSLSLSLYTSLYISMESVRCILLFNLTFSGPLNTCLPNTSSAPRPSGVWMIPCLWTDWKNAHRTDDRATSRRCATCSWMKSLQYLSVCTLVGYTCNQATGWGIQASCSTIMGLTSGLALARNGEGRLNLALAWAHQIDFFLNQQALTAATHAETWAFPFQQ